MASTTRHFIVYRSDGSYLVDASTSGSWGSGAGIAAIQRFPSEEAAKGWASEQFGIPDAAWKRRGDGSLEATL